MLFLFNHSYNLFTYIYNIYGVFNLKGIIYIYIQYQSISLKHKIGQDMPKRPNKGGGNQIHLLHIIIMKLFASKMVSR